MIEYLRERVRIVSRKLVALSETLGLMTSILAFSIIFMIALSAPALIKVFGKAFVDAFAFIWEITLAWCAIIWQMLCRIF